MMLVWQQVKLAAMRMNWAGSVVYNFCWADLCLAQRQERLVQCKYVAQVTDVV